jgi:predicted porin
LRAIFQIESGANVDSGSGNGQNGAPNPNTGFLASRDSWAGIEGDNFGRLTFGRQSVYWYNGTINQIGVNQVNVQSPLSSVNLSGIAIGPAQREANTTQYSLRFGDFSGTVSYALPNSASTTLGGGGPSESVQAGQSIRERIWGLTLRYNHAMFDVQADWATRYNVSQVEGRDFSGIKLGAAWKYMPGAQVAVLGQWVKNEKTNGIGLSNYGTGAPSTCGVSLTAGNAGLSAQQLGALSAFNTLGGGGAVNTCDTLKQDSYVINWEHTFGNIQPILEYSWAGDVKGSTHANGLPDSSVQAWTAAVRYIFSKRTWVYLSYAQIKNGKNNYVDFWGGWTTSANQLGGTAPGLPSSSSGADPRIVALGLMHNF